MSTTFGTTRFLVIGFGNPGRVDDGLGPALAECVAALGLANVATEAYYQLSVEDCLEVALADVVIFVDATVEQEHAFDLRPLAADPELSFTTHAVSPGAILALAESVHGARPEAYLLTIRGHEFDRFSEGLSLAGRRDLAAAFEFLTPLLQARDPDLLRERAAALALEHRSLPSHG